MKSLRQYSNELSTARNVKRAATEGRVLHSNNWLGLFCVDEALKPSFFDIHNGVYANRFIHRHSN